MGGHTGGQTGGATAGAMNIVVLRGVVSRAPEVRELASGARVVQLEVSTRAGEGAGGRVTVPVAWADPPGPPPDVGTDVVVTGHVHRRFFRAGGGTQSRTEVVAHAVVPARSRVRARHAIEAALAVITGAGG